MQTEDAKEGAQVACGRAASSLMTLDEARAKLARARGLTDLDVMVKAFDGYDGPEVSGCASISREARGTADQNADDSLFAESNAPCIIKGSDI